MTVEKEKDGSGRVLVSEQKKSNQESAPVLEPVKKLKAESKRRQNQEWKLSSELTSQLQLKSEALQALQGQEPAVDSQQTMGPDSKRSPVSVGTNVRY